MHIEQSEVYDNFVTVMYLNYAILQIIFPQSIDMLRC